jgi:integrase
MSENEIHTFLNAAMDTGYYALYYTILFTGMRRSEVLALRWYDIDLLLCTISVSRSIHRLRTGDYIFRQPKSAKGRCTIALTPSIVYLLKEHQESMNAARLMLGLSLKETDLVFLKCDGSPSPGYNHPGMV